MKRLFIAVKIVLSSPFVEYAKQMKKQFHFDRIVWVDTHVTHLTLRFLGKTPEYKIPELIDILEDVGRENSSFSLDMNKLGVFGSRYAPSVIWFGFHEFDPYKQLFNSLEEKLLKSGFEPNRGNIVPHVTIGRVKGMENKKNFWHFIEQHQPDFSQKIEIKELLLYQSKLQPDGPVYKIIKCVDLQESH